MRTPWTLEILVMAAWAASILSSWPALSWAQTGGNEAGEPMIALRVVGKEEMVSDWSGATCAQPGDRVIHVPDAPVTAFRRDDGSVVLLAVNRRNILLEGPKPEAVSRQSCRSALTSLKDPDPSHFQDNEWLLAVLRFPSGRFVGFVHNEYHGYEHGLDGCRTPAGERQSHRCWYAATTYVVSEDGGHSFRRVPPPDNVVASVPYRFNPTIGRVGLSVPKALFNPLDGRFYLMVTSNGNYQGQRYGQCLLRGTSDDVAAWRAWDGEGFTLTLKSPYAEAGARPCPVVLPFNIWSVRYLPQKKMFIALGQKGRRLIYLTSRDLVRWSRPETLFSFTPYQGWKPGDPEPTLYYSLLDPKSSSSNFDTIEQDPYLYYVKWQLHDGRPVNGQRDIVRVKLRID